VIYKFETCALSTERRELLFSSLPRAIEPQVFDLLALLIRNRNRYVSKDEIIRTIWDGRAISDATLHSRINAARAVIGDNGNEQRLIATLRSTGFRFVGAVSECPERTEFSATTAGDWRHLQFGTRDLPGILVLPFTASGGQQRHASQAEAFTDELITTLAGASCVSVVSRRTAFALRNKTANIRSLARRVRARYAVEGNFCISPQTFDLSVHLIDASSDRIVFSARRKGETADLHTRIPRELAAEVTARIQALEHLRARMRREQQRNWWDRVLILTSWINSRDRTLIARAESALRRAIDEDPTSAQALSLLSIISTLSVHQGWLPRSLQIPKALQLAEEALRSTPQEPWAHLAVGYARIWVHPDEALPKLHDAIDLCPGSSFGHYLAALASAWGGHGARALGYAERARQSSPFDVLSYGCEGTIDSVCATACFANGQYRDGIQLARKAALKSPRMPSAHRALLMNCALGGEKREAQAALQRTKQLSPDLSLAWIQNTTVWATKENQAAYRNAFQSAGLK
jgi:DNA-binding winged helix-turn-helix (wHTH) protein